MRQTNLSLFISFLVATIFLSGCLKSKEDTYTITGHIYESCGVPATNQTFLFYQSGGGAKDAGSATTDATGAFSLTYNRNNGSDLKVGEKAGFGYADYMHVRSNINYKDVKIYKQPTCYLRISMQVFNTSYTNQDTLYVTNFNYSLPPFKLLAFPGPFTNRLVYSVPKFPIRNYVYPNSFEDIVYKINNGNTTIRSFEVSACDTINAIAEIR